MLKLIKKMLHARKDYKRIQDPSNGIGKDEPVFLLRAQDLLAPRIVEEWAKLAESNLVDKEMVKLARKHAKKMREWQKKNGAKLPDLVKIEKL